jgi:hypothetical protein
MRLNSSRFDATSKKPPELFDARPQLVVSRSQILKRDGLDHSNLRKLSVVRRPLSVVLVARLDP